TIETPPAGPGDYDADGDVDGNDFLVWQRGGSPNGAIAGDLQEWETNYGNAASVTALASVPEPATGLLLWMGVCGLLSRRRM
ncbi:MAG: PEP-CTERM sorting domain-containing protein, partial [Chloroflexi bacterium]|nr:PEP-CTERM sorting domain-containing protein [Chloroflexota bacterium]